MCHIHITRKINPLDVNLSTRRLKLPTVAQTYQIIFHPCRSYQSNQKVINDNGKISFITTARYHSCLQNFKFKRNLRTVHYHYCKPKNEKYIIWSNIYRHALYLKWFNFKFLLEILWNYKVWCAFLLCMMKADCNGSSSSLIIFRCAIDFQIQVWGPIW